MSIETTLPDERLQTAAPSGQSASAVEPKAGLGELPSGLQVIPVIAEALHVERREREGRVRIRKIVHEHEQTVDEALRDERVTVERIAIGRRLDAPAGVRHDGEVMIVPVVEERLIVEKQLFLVEELHIRREVRTRHDPQRVTLRREEVVVERHDPATDTWTPVDATPPSPFPATAASGDDAARAFSRGD